MPALTSILRSVSSSDQVASLPARIFIESFRTRLKAEDTLDVTTTVGFRFPDIGEAYGVAIRRGVAEFVDHLPENTDLALTLDKTVLDRIRLGSLTMRDAVLRGAVKWSGGSPLAIARFFGYFEMPFSKAIRYQLAGEVVDLDQNLGSPAGQKDRAGLRDRHERWVQMRMANLSSGSSA